MPSQILHVMFGEDVINRICRRAKKAAAQDQNTGKSLAAKLQKMLNEHKRSFRLGCQGPDIFYHNRRHRPVGIEYGTLLHRRGFGRFAAELLRLATRRLAALSNAAPEQTDFDALIAYAVGFMTHACLDRAAHPYIVYKTYLFSPHKQDSLSSAQSHAFFERIIDSLMFKKLRGKDIEKWDQERELADVCLNPPAGLKELLANALSTAYPERAGKDQKLLQRIENTFHDSARFYRMTAPANASLAILKKNHHLDKDHIIYIHPEIVPQSVDFLNEQKRTWFNPCGNEGIELNQSLPETYETAVEYLTINLPANLNSCFSGKMQVNEIAENLGNGGLSIVDKEGSPCLPVRSDPLPFDDIIKKLLSL